MNELLKKENKENSDLPSESLKEKIISGKDELVKNKVPPFQDGYYVCFIHPRKLEELIAYQYSSLLPAEEEGKKFYVDCFGIKYIPTQIPSLIKRSDNKKVYQTIIIGTDAYEL
jgi:CRISPR/Cas system-associated endonuclease/helicase Cas3